MLAVKGRLPLQAAVALESLGPCAPHSASPSRPSALAPLSLWLCWPEGDTGPPHHLRREPGRAGEEVCAPLTPTCCPCVRRGCPGGHQPPHGGHLVKSHRGATTNVLPAGTGLAPQAGGGVSVSVTTGGFTCQIMNLCKLVPHLPETPAPAEHRFPPTTAPEKTRIAQKSLLLCLSCLP